MPAAAEDSQHLAFRDVLVWFADLGDTVGRWTESDRKFLSLCGRLKKTLGDIGKGIFVIIHIDHLPFDEVALDHRPESNFLKNVFFDVTQFLDRLSFCNMAGDLDKYIPGGESKIIRILDHVQVNNEFRLFIKDQRKDPIIGAYEIVTVALNQGMRIFYWGFSIYG